MVSMNYATEPMSLDDFDAVLALWRCTEGVGLTESDNKSNIELFLKRNPGLSFVARNEKREIIGAVLCGHDGRRGYLHHLAVATEHRRRRIGTALADRCLAELKKLKMLKCNIFVYGSNAEGKRYWERHGWRVREDLRLMQKTIE